MFYEKKVKYLDYLVSGEKKRGAGFVKTEVREKDLRMNIMISGIYTAKPLETDIIVKGAGKTAVLRRIRLNNGSGDSGEIRMNASHLGGGLSYGELEQIVIPLSEKCEIVCMWRKEPEKGEKQEADARSIIRESQKAAERQEVTEIQEVTARRRVTEDQEVRRDESRQIKHVIGNDKEARESMEVNPGREMSSGQDVPRQGIEEQEAYEGQSGQPDGYQGKESLEKNENEIEKAEKAEKDKVGEVSAEKNPIKGDLTGEAPEASSSARRIDGYDRNEKMPCEDKWRQLANIYPHMDIAAEISDCITIKPADFVIFPTKYYSLVTNSFLLHGYHNYGHLVLARVEKRGEIRYYIGVPGIFFDRERQVALMFGFESFECGKDFAKEGDYGYYMIRVEL